MKETEKRMFSKDISGADDFLPRSILRCQIPIRVASAQIFEIVAAPGILI